LNNSEAITPDLQTQKKVKQFQEGEITISPFVMSMVAEHPISADYDYKAEI
jgi:hypothetical protein